MREFWESHAEFSSTELSREQLAVMRHCGDPRGLRVLELGCGSGAMSRALAARGAKVTAVDFSEAMLKRAGELPGGQLVEFRQFDATQLDLDRRFDRIIGTSFLHEIDQVHFEPFVKRLESHLEDGGRIVFMENSFFNPVFRFVRRNLVDRGLLRKVGSLHETPFDRQRYEILEKYFNRVERRIDVFVLFSRAFGQFLAYQKGLGWTLGIGKYLDALLGCLPPRHRIALAWSYQQTILAEGPRRQLNGGT
jgi:ubiquinone/menaquinone biosynthesis C-methylase UbiE